MKRIRLAVGALCVVAAGGCAATEPVGPTGVISHYTLQALNAAALPCCAYTDSVGHLRTLIYGALDVFRDGTYSWQLNWKFTEGGITTYIVGPTFSWGTWTWNREELVLSDSTGLGRLNASVSASGANIDVLVRGRTYSFLKRPMPIEGQYVLYTVDSTLVPCCARDSTGIRITITGAELDLGWNTAPGHYRVLLSERYDYPNGASASASSTFTTGAYVWDADTESLTLDGSVLTPLDSPGAAPAAGWRKGRGLTLSTANHQYVFSLLIQIP